MGTAFDLQAIGAAFAEAAVDPSRWDAAMEVAEKATGSVGALLFDINGHLPRIPRSRRTAPAHDAYVRDGWMYRDERYRLEPFFMRRGVATDLDLFKPGDIDKHPYYQEFLAPFGLRWCALVKVAAGDVLWSLSLQRSIDQGPFPANELAELADLSTHLGSAGALARALGFARVEAASDAFDASGTAVVMMDQCGKVIRTNSAAEQLLGPDLQVSSCRLVSAHRDATVAIQKSLWQLLHAVEPRSSTPPVALPRAGRRPLLAYPMRLPAVSPNSLAPCQAVVVLLDPDARPRPPEAVLRSCFGLTASEARLARHVSSGEALEAAADELAISYETARNHLKAIFAKTDTHRQGDLIALLARIASGPSGGP
ncbi:helix-turn-helix transcriptional regulator [Mesorhizobium sp.]|uniref:helix-turn-helix transcriptional regulator n=1 Tax=Mesorhizobium sp. TaxID=1871066 RepID=UPI001223E548|nr:helix-turn-helix transcriptional regulator [Mesorhizobium sp.]TIS49136.1 MAG: helix-turn-helix transcriptional regulator [Mesorhizobium sp.]